jgi:hypothetical protein
MAMNLTGATSLSLGEPLRLRQPQQHPCLDAAGPGTSSRATSCPSVRFDLWSEQASANVNATGTGDAVARVNGTETDAVKVTVDLPKHANDPDQCRERPAHRGNNQRLCLERQFCDLEKRDASST